MKTIPSRHTVVIVITEVNRHLTCECSYPHSHQTHTSQFWIIVFIISWLMVQWGRSWGDTCCWPHQKLRMTGGLCNNTCSVLMNGWQRYIVSQHSFSFSEPTVSFLKASFSKEPKVCCWLLNYFKTTHYYNIQYRYDHHDVWQVTYDFC